MITKKMTSLHFAAEAGSNQITEWLISIGKNLNARDHRNRTPLDLAKEDKYCIGPIKAAKNKPPTSSANTAARRVKN